MTAAFKSLVDHFAEIFDGTDKDPLEHIVILSYEFDDQQVLNLVVQRPLSEQFEPRVVDMVRVAETVPVTIYDARKTRENNRLPHFMELLAVRKPAWTCHHSKAYLVVTRDRIHLILGSMNLTASGMFLNREVFETFRWADDETGDRGVIEEFVRVVRKGYISFNSAPLEKALGVVERRLEKWHGKPRSEGVTLIHQGYDDITGMDLLAQVWRQQFGNLTPKRAIAVSPFFDRNLSESVYADELLKTFPSLQRLDIITDETVGKYLCQRHFGKIENKCLLLIPQEMTPSERKRIAEANDPVDIGDLAIARKLHAKILVLTGGDKSLIYIGSANFTRKAWCGGNHEMGVARVHKGDIEAVLRTLCQGLSVGKVDHFADLPESQPAADIPTDEEEYQVLQGYPDFVQGIELVESSRPGILEFVVRVEPDRIGDMQKYFINWGASEIQFTAERSQGIEPDRLFSCLLGGRNLKFTSRSDPTNAYFLPFRHAPALFAQRERYVFPSAEDWMSFYLGAESEPWRDPNEYLPGDRPYSEDDPAALMHANRNANPVIQMQQYLSLFSRIEYEFRKRIMTSDEAAVEDRVRIWDSQVSAPLSTFADVICCRCNRDTMDKVTLFKMGELLLFVRSLTQTTPRAKVLLATLVAKLPKSSDDSVIDEYLKYCHQGE